MLKHCRTSTSTRDGLGTQSSNNIQNNNTQKRSASVPPKLDRNTATMVQPGTGTSEQCLMAARASVVLYDDIYKKWIPSGSLPAGVSKVQILHNPNNKTYRLVARKIQDKEVTLNVNVVSGLKYSEATPTFHQWRDALHTIHGLNFSTKDDAVNFSKTINAVLQCLRHQSKTGGILSQTPIDQQLHIEVPRSQSASSRILLHGSSSHDNLLLSRGSSSNNTTSHNESYDQTLTPIRPEPQQQTGYAPGALFQSPQQQQHFPQVSSTQQPHHSNIQLAQQLRGYSDPQINATTVPPINKSQFNQPIYESPPHSDYNSNSIKSNNDIYNPVSSSSSQHDLQGFSTIKPGRSGSIGSSSGSDSQYGSMGLHQQPNSTQPIYSDPAPPAPPLAGPPPPPPIPVGGIPKAPPAPSAFTSDPSSSNTAPQNFMNGLAAALQGATLKKTTPKVDTGGVPPPLVGAKAVLMEEMQRKLARRRAKADGEESPSDSIRSSPFHGISRSNTVSPMTVVKPTPIAPEPQPVCNKSATSQGNTTLQSCAYLPSELEQLKRELLLELRADMDDLRAGLLSAIRQEFSQYRNQPS